MVSEKLQVVGIGLVGLLIMFSSFYVVTATAFPDNPGTQAYFDKICNQPYIFTEGPSNESHFWKYGGDCDDRAMVFATYLKSKGATNVQICWVCRLDENGTMIPIYDGTLSGHVFVVWNNQVYNPANPKNHRFYNTDITTFKKFLKETYGFNTWYFENQTVGTPF
jgi:hypothetical protein